MLILRDIVDAIFHSSLSSPPKNQQELPLSSFFVSLLSPAASEVRVFNSERLCVHEYIKGWGGWIHTHSTAKAYHRI